MDEVPHYEPETTGTIEESAPEQPSDQITKVPDDRLAVLESQVEETRQRVAQAIQELNQALKERTA